MFVEYFGVIAYKKQDTLENNYRVTASAIYKPKCVVENVWCLFVEYRMGET
jgi:hypothetical protein